MRASKSMYFPDGRGSIVVIRSRTKARNCQNCTMFMYVKYAEFWRLEQFQIFQAQQELQLQKVGQCLYLLAKNTHSLAWRKEIQTTCRIYQKDFSNFTGPNLFCSEKIIKSEPPNVKRRPSKQSQISEGTGSKEEDRRREAVIREFVGEYGKRCTTGKRSLKDERVDWHTSICLQHASLCHHSLIGRLPRRNNSLPNRGC